MQQKIIDVLDTAEYVEITGKGENQTNMQVQLAAISNPEKADEVLRTVWRM